MRFGARSTLLPGMALIVAGLLLFALAPVDGSYVPHVLPPMILFGVGAGLSFPALMNLAMSGATREDAGLASGLVNTSAQVGGALGLAVLATLSATRSEELVDGGAAVAAALTDGYHLAFAIGQGSCSPRSWSRWRCSSPWGRPSQASPASRSAPSRRSPRPGSRACPPTC